MPDGVPLELVCAGGVVLFVAIWLVLGHVLDARRCDRCDEPDDEEGR